MNFLACVPPGCPRVSSKNVSQFSPAVWLAKADIQTNIYEWRALLYRLYDVSNLKIEWPRHLIHFIQITSVVRLMRLMKLKSVNQIQLNQSILIFLGLFPYLFSKCNMKYYQRLFRHTRMCVHENTPVWTQSILKLEEKCKFILFFFIFLF